MSELPDPRLDDNGRPIPMSACPACGYKMDAATACDEKNPGGIIRPRPEDLTVCLKCAASLQYAPDMTLRLVDIDTLDTDNDTKFQVRRIQQNIRVMNLKKLYDP